MNVNESRAVKERVIATRVTEEEAEALEALAEKQSATLSAFVHDVLSRFLRRNGRAA